MPVPTNIRDMPMTAHDVLRASGNGTIDETKYPWEFIECSNYSGAFGDVPNVQLSIHKAFMDKLIIEDTNELYELWENLRLPSNILSSAPLCHGVHKKRDIPKYIASKTSSLDQVKLWGFRPISNVMYVIYSADRLYSNPIIFYNKKKCITALNKYKRSNIDWDDVADHSFICALGRITNIREVI